MLGVVQRHAGRRDQVAVRAEPVDERLDERRPLARAGALDRRADRLVDRERIAAVHRDAGHAERLRLHCERLARGGVRVLLVAARVHVVVVVLHHEHDRELPERRDVQRLVECALLRGAVAEEAEHDLALAADLGGPGRAGRVRDPLADDPGGPEEAALRVDQVHRAAVAAAEPVLAAVDLGHHRLRVGAERDRVAVTAVRRQHLVVGVQRRQRADDRRLGPVGEVRVAADHAGVLLERALHPLLELADAQHLREHPDKPVFVEAVVRHRGSFRGLARRSARSGDAAAPMQTRRRSATVGPNLTRPRAGTSNPSVRCMVNSPDAECAPPAKSGRSRAREDRQSGPFARAVGGHGTCFLSRVQG